MNIFKRTSLRTGESLQPSKLAWTETGATIQMACEEPLAKFEIRGQHTGDPKVMSLRFRNTLLVAIDHAGKSPLSIWPCTFL
jgi:hypothetical protein